jgi:flagellin
VNSAIASINRNRGTLGAAESRLDVTIKNLEVARENFKAAESRIRDVDVATEAAELTRLNILQQAGTAILAQANQQPQLALRLIQA